jgi:hypothetical protein
MHKVYISTLRMVINTDGDISPERAVLENENHTYVVQ